MAKSKSRGKARRGEGGDASSGDDLALGAVSREETPDLPGVPVDDELLRRADERAAARQEALKVEMQAQLKTQMEQMSLLMAA